MSSTLCPECGEDRGKPLQTRTGVCYPCFLDGGGPGFSFVGGGGYTRAAFHDKTNAEVIRENSTHPNAEFTGSSWYSGPSA